MRDERIETAVNALPAGSPNAVAGAGRRECGRQYWAAIDPVDPGTAAVVSNGMVIILLDKTGKLGALQRGLFQASHQSH